MTTRKYGNWSWSRRPHLNKKNYEFSSQGDRRFSPLFAKLPNGDTVEQWYQLDLKGYRSMTSDWMVAKNLPPRNKLTREQMYQAFKGKLVEFLLNNRPLLEDFIKIARTHNNFLDRFASTDINQARAYADIANDMANNKIEI